MDTLIVTSFFVVEVVSLSIIINLWLRRRMHIILRMFWSVLLLVPFFGLLMFVFVVSDLDPNPEKTDTGSDSDAFDGGGGHGDGGGGGGHGD